MTLSLLPHPDITKSGLRRIVLLLLSSLGGALRLPEPSIHKEAEQGQDLGRADKVLRFVLGSP